MWQNGTSWLSLIGAALADEKWNPCESSYESYESIHWFLYGPKNWCSLCSWHFMALYVLKGPKVDNLGIFGSIWIHFSKLHVISSDFKRFQSAFCPPTEINVPGPRVALRFEAAACSLRAESAGGIFEPPTCGLRPAAESHSDDLGVHRRKIMENPREK